MNHYKTILPKMDNFGGSPNITYGGAAPQLRHLLNGESIRMPAPIEIPEIITVDTRILNTAELPFVDRQTMHTITNWNTMSYGSSFPSTQNADINAVIRMAIQNRLDFPYQVGSDQLSTVNNFPNLITTKTTINGSTQTMIPEYKDAMQQTDGKKFEDIGIQCCLDDNDDDDNEFKMDGSEPDKIVEEEEEQNVKKELQEFAKLNSFSYTNGKQECLRCGEICINQQRLLKHMSLHFGIPELCANCGLKFPNAILFAEHKCEATKLMQKNKKPRFSISLKCPHYRCRVTAISKLELYDHINEHISNPIYKCRSCACNFLTAGELFSHLSFRKKCRDNAQRQRLPYQRFTSRKDIIYRRRVLPVYLFKRKRVIMKMFLSEKMKKISASIARRCSVCLKYCSNDLKFKCHTKRCLKAFQKRLLKKRQLEDQKNP